MHKHPGVAAFMNIRIVSALLAALALSFSHVARAEWREAQSDHFVIYADTGEKNLRRFAEMLERYHAAMEFITGNKTETPSPSNRVTIFTVGSKEDIRELYGNKKSRVGGFYIPRAGGSRAFVPDVKMRSGETDFSVTILLHEYAHHFLISASRHAMPRWLSEGSAEFFASAKLASGDVLEIGRPAYHRNAELQYASRVTVPELLDPELYRERHGNRFASFYGRSWALYHYLSFDEERKGQLTAYWRAVAGGTDSVEAAEQIFGDLDALEKDLRRYLKRTRLNGFRIEPHLLPIGDIAIREVSEGMGEMLPIMFRSQRGVSREEALELLPEAREVAAQFPNDARVLAALAEAEFDAGNDAEAIAAADRALAIDDTVKNAYVQKGYALFRKAEDAEDADAAYRAAMRPFSRLNKLETDHPLPLIYYYRSFVQRGVSPTENARHALERASMLAPFDQSLAMNVAMMQAEEGKIELAKYNLAPLAANPHGGRLAGSAKVLLAALDGAPEGKPFRMTRLAGLVTRPVGDDDEGASVDESEEEPSDPDSEDGGDEAGS